MIRQNNKKVIPYNNDYEPTKISKGDEVIFDYEKKTASGKEVSIVSEYKPKPKVEINGDESQVVKDVNVESVNGIGLKYNQLVQTADTTYTSRGLTITRKGNLVSVVGTATETYSALEVFGSHYYGSFKYIANHKYLFLCSNFQNMRIVIGGSSSPLPYNEITTNTIATATIASNTGTGYFIPRMSITNGQTYNYQAYFMCVDLTDMFGAGNEPTTLEQFYATRQGKLYKSYVEYDYHILGAGEYLSNQLILNSLFNTLDNWQNTSGLQTELNNNEVSITFTSNGQAIQTDISIKANHKYLCYCNKLISNNNGILGVRFRTLTDNVIKELLTNNYNSGGFIIESNSNQTLRTYLRAQSINQNTIGTFSGIVVRELTELGLQDLTLDQLKSQRPDLFVPQPYHTTEKRIGIIFNDGSVDRLDKPLYAVNDIKDEYKTNGVVNRKFGVVVLGSLTWKKFNGGGSWLFYADIPNGKTYIGAGNQINVICSKYTDKGYALGGTPTAQGEDKSSNWDGTNSQYLIKDTSYTDETDFKNSLQGVYLIYELATPTTELREPIAEDKVLPIVNEPYTQSVEQTPSPSYPREIEHTSKFKWNDLELPLDLYNGDKIIASRKVGKNIWEGLKYFQGLSYTSHYQYFKQGTYTISFHYQLLGTDTSNTTLFLDKGEIRLSIFNSIRFTTNDYSYNFTVNESGIYNVKLYCASVSGYLDNIMICLASEVDKTYEPYLKDKVMCLSKYKKITLTNTMTWYEWTDGTLQAGYKGYFTYDLPIAQNKKGICNRFVRSELAWGGYPVGFNFHGSYTSFNLKTSNMPTIQSWIDFITNNDVYVVYEDEPQWIDLTDTLGSMLNDLTPNATQEFSVDNGTLQVDYYKAKER